MQKVLGVLLIILGIGLGVYVGGYLLFVGGVVQLIEGIKIVEALSIAVGLLKIMFAAITGWGIVLLCGFIGTVLLSD